MTHEQLATGEHQTRKPSGRGRFWLALTVMLAICLFAAYRSELFRLASVNVTGTQRLAKARVVEIAGLAPGAPRWQHTAASIEARLREEPWVKSVKVSWDWNRLLIEIEEREAVGLLRYQSAYVALDETALILEQVETPAGQKTPVVGGVHTNTAIRGQRLPHPGLQDALFVLSWIDKPLRAQISEVAVDGRQLTLFMAAGTTVRLGEIPLGSERTPTVQEKVKQFGTLWSQVAKERAPKCVIDLRVAEHGNGFTSGCQ